MTSRGNFGKHPCKVVYNKEQKRWKWEKPKWFEEMGFYTFATYVQQRMETHLWMCYWDSQKKDPRRDPSSMIYKPDAFSLQNYQGLCMFLFRKNLRIYF